MKPCAIAILIVSQPLLADESKEPDLEYRLTIGDRSYAITEGKPFDIQPFEGVSKAKLVAAEHRVFPHAGLQFKYPRYYTFEADLGDATDRSWTLSGNNCKLMVLQFEAPLTPLQFADNLAEHFGKENTKTAKAEIRLGKKTYAGATADALVAGTRLKMQIAALPSRKGWSKLLVLQDSPDDAGKPSAEHRQLSALLDETFVETNPK